MAIMYPHDHHTVFRKEFIDSNDSHFSDSNSPLWFWLLSDSINDSLRKPSTDVNTAYGEMLTEQDIVKISWFLFCGTESKWVLSSLDYTSHHAVSISVRDQNYSHYRQYTFSHSRTLFDVREEGTDIWWGKWLIFGLARRLSKISEARSWGAKLHGFKAPDGNTNHLDDSCLMSAAYSIMELQSKQNWMLEFWCITVMSRALGLHFAASLELQVPRM